MANAEDVTPAAAVAGDTLVGILLRRAAFNNRLECMLYVLLDNVHGVHAFTAQVEVWGYVSLIPGKEKVDIP